MHMYMYMYMYMQPHAHTKVWAKQARTYIYALAYEQFTLCKHTLMYIRMYK